MTEPKPGEGPFQPYISKRAVGTVIAVGPSWGSDYAKASLHRIRSSASVEEAHAQATTEVAILLHSIRRILIWTAVIMPTVFVVLGIVLTIALADTPAPTRYTYP